MELAAQFRFAAQFMIDIITIRDCFRIRRNVGKNIGDELFFRWAVTDIFRKKLYRQITAGVRADLEKFFVRIRYQQTELLKFGNICVFHDFSSLWALTVQIRSPNSPCFYYTSTKIKSKCINFLFIAIILRNLQ